MAKLAEKINPEELLTEIRTGTLLADLIKQYKTTTEELAMMLHPLYVEERMTKDEFNRFFRGESLTAPPADSAASPPEAAPAPEQVAEEPENQPGAVSSIFKIFARGSQSAAKDNASTEVEIVMTPPEAAPPQAPPLKEEAAGVDRPPVFDRIPEAAEQTVELTPPQRDVKVPPQVGAAVGPGAPKKPTVPVPRSLVEQLLGRLDSIDSRLARIEKRLGIQVEQ